MNIRDDNSSNQIDKKKSQNILLNVFLYSTVFNVLFLIFIFQAIRESADNPNWFWFAGAILMLIISGVGSVLIIKGRLKIVG